MANHPAPDLTELLLGTPFRARARLGVGGMGEVYEAIGPFGGEPVVVKLLRADHTGQADLVERLLREGEMLRWITHPNVVVSHGHGKTAAGRPYVVFERLFGLTLRQELIRRGAFPVREAVHATRQLLSALACVHDAGVVHRDVKPSNVMLCNLRSDVHVKLIDFGIAKVSRAARHKVGPIAFPTREGVCLGTPRFVSPEQVSGVDVDPRSDIYAAGMLLYTLVAGRGPFDDIVGVDQLLAAHLVREPTPPSRFMTTPLPAALENVILRALAKRPDARFADARAFERELEHAFVETGGSRAGTSARRIPLPVPYAIRPRSMCCRMAAVPRAYGVELVHGAQGHRSNPGEKGTRSEGAGLAIPIVWSETLTRIVGRAPSWAATPPAPDRRRDMTTREPRPSAAERDGGASDHGARATEKSLGSARNTSAPADPIRQNAEKSSLLRSSISRRGVLASATLFFAVAGGLAMWFVR
jgi:serine/threonine-protein kinase